MIRDAVKMPEQFVSYARASHRPRSSVVAAFEQTLAEDLGSHEDERGA
jgi:hypothetical protein